MKVCSSQKLGDGQFLLDVLIIWAQILVTDRPIRADPVLGFGSKMIITGDKTQIDLPRGAESGLIAAETTLSKVRGLHFQYLERGDVVRHPLVAKIIAAYEDQPS